MSKFWGRIIAAITRLHRARKSEDCRQTPRFICRYDVRWESGLERGRGELREISPQGMRLRLDSALVTGRHIRIRPARADDRSALAIDVAVGTVVYSKTRRGRFDVGVELLHPDRFSRFTWFHQLRRHRNEQGSRLPVITSGRKGTWLRVVQSTSPTRSTEL